MLFTIYNHQIAALDKKAEQQFIVRSREFLRLKYPDWSEQKTEEELNAFIFGIINFAKFFQFKDERVLQELMILEIENKMLQFFPFPKAHTKVLQNKGRDEIIKIEFLKDFLTYWKKNTHE